MSTFAQMARTRIRDAASRGRLTNPHRDLEGDRGRAAVATGLAVVQGLAASNVVCAQDGGCKEVATVLQVAGQGSPADVRTALTQLQRLLSTLTAADSDVAADEAIQQLRRDLHLCLDH